MTIKEFLQENTLTAVDTVQGLILNLVCGDITQGINVDTSNIPSGMVLTRRTDFVLTEDTLSVDNISINIITIELL